MNSKTRKQLLSFAAATGVLFQFGGTAHAVQVFDLGEFVVHAPARVAVAETTEATTPVVEGAYAGGQVSQSSLMGVLGNQSFIDTPFNVTGYTNELMENKQASNVIDIVANDASVKDQSLSGASSAWSIRGFRTTQQDTQFNGLYNISPRFYTGTESIERVDVIKGPAALLGGMPPNGTIGGTINFVPKRATDKDITKVKLSYGNGSQFTQHVDVGHRFGDNNKYGVRVNVLNRNGETSNDNEKNNASTVAIGADMRGEKARAAIDLGYVYNEIENPQYRITFGNKFLASTKQDVFTVKNADHHKKYGADGTYRRVTEKYGVISGEYDFNKNWTAYAGFGMRYTSMDYLYNEFQVNDINGKSNLRYRYNNQINKSTSVEVGVKGKITTGDVNHNIGVAFARSEYKRYMANRSLNNVAANFYVQTTNWGAPQGDLNWYTHLNDTSIQTGVSITDRITTKDESWQLIVGGRLQKIKTQNFPRLSKAFNGADTYASYDKTAFSPAVGIVHKFNDKTSVYANYMEGLQADTVTNASAVNFGEAVEPYKAKQYEVGTKFDFGKYTATVSAFNIKTPALSYVTVTPVNKLDRYYSLSTEIRNRGLEFNVFGEPTKGTRVLGGFMLLDSRYTKDNADSNAKGHRVEGTSKVNAVVGLEQDVKGVQGLTFTTRLNYTGPAFANQDNTIRVPGYFTWDLGARYTWNSGHVPMTVRADVYNVLNKDYWNALNGSVYQGNGRTAMVSLTAGF